MDGELEDYYRNAPLERDSLRLFVRVRLVRALMALGKDATIRYWETEQIKQYRDIIEVSMIYAVTYGPPHERTTFFFRIVLVGERDPQTEKLGWRIEKEKIEGGIAPQSMK